MDVRGHLFLTLEESRARVALLYAEPAPRRVGDGSIGRRVAVRVVLTEVSTSPAVDGERVPQWVPVSEYARSLPLAGRPQGHPGH